MNASDFTAFYFGVRSSIYFYWNFYIAGVLVAGGWLMTSQRALVEHETVIAILLFLLFSVSCISSKILNYSILESARLDLLAKLSEEREDYNLSRTLNRSSYSRHWILVYAVHAIVGALVIWLIIQK